VKYSSRFVVATVVVTGCLLVSAGPTNASTDSSTTSSTVPSSDNSSASTSTTTTTVVPASTAAEISALYPTRALRFPPYTRLNPPEVPTKSGSGRRVVYKNSLQWIWVIDSQNNVVRVMPVSGRRGVPSVGTYKVNSQSLRSYSLDYEGVWFNNMTRFALGPEGGNIGFHAIPTKNGKPLQTVDQLGSFQGSGCLRLLSVDAKFIFEFAKVGTTIVVVN
jgi:lipoprotein-anchoring transpeptidase ErfK/SrfK